MSQPLEPRPIHPVTALPVPYDQPLTGPVELAADRPVEPVVYVPDAYGRMVPVHRSQADALRAAVPATAPRDLAPRPVIDPVAQRLAAGGVLALGLGVGGWLLFNVWTALTLGGAAALALALKLPSGSGGGRSGGGDTYITNNNRWWGRSTTTN